MEEKPAMVHVFCMIIAAFSSQVSGQWHWGLFCADLVALPINKHHTVVVWHWATKGNPGSKEPDFIRSDSLAFLEVQPTTGATQWEEATVWWEGLTGGKIACSPCRDH
jgi:hypothetical protein